MSHRKVRSQGSIPFSWETIPGVCKLAAIPAFIDSPKSNDLDEGSVNLRKLPIPLPPCITGTYLRNMSLDRPKHDPFLVAFKECTRNIALPVGKCTSKFGFRAIGKKSMFSCKSSCDVREDNFVKLSRLPPIPKGRSRSTEVQ